MGRSAQGCVGVCDVRLAGDPEREALEALDSCEEAFVLSEHRTRVVGVMGRFECFSHSAQGVLGREMEERRRHGRFFAGNLACCAAV